MAESLFTEWLFPKIIFRRSTSKNPVDK
jgi:hypothetical protein